MYIYVLTFRVIIVTIGLSHTHTYSLTLCVMSATLNKTESEVTQLGLLSLSTSPSSTSGLSEHTGNTMTVGEWPRVDPDNSTFTSLPYTEPKQGFLCLKFLGSKRKQFMVISAVIVILTVSVAILPPILFIYITVWPLNAFITLLKFGRTLTKLLWYHTFL